MIPTTLARGIILVVGILHPGYASFKSIRTKSVDNYINWMIYWIIFAGFCGMEHLTDIVFRFFPLYQEVKLLLLIWLLPSQSNGSAFIYKQLMHPFLTSHEKLIDEFLNRLQHQGYDAIMSVVRHSIVYIYNYVAVLVQRNWPISLMPPSKTQILALPATNRHIDSLMPTPIRISELNGKSENILLMTEHDDADGTDMTYDLGALFYHDSNTRLSKRRDLSVGSVKSLGTPLNTVRSRRALSRSSQ